jgi:hypothetical protein
MTCQECEIKLGMGENAAEHLASCKECRLLARELRLNSLALREMRVESVSTMWGGPPGPRPTPSSAFGCIRTAGPGGPARTRASAPHTNRTLAAAAVILMAIFLRMPRVEKLPSPVHVAVSAPQIKLPPVRVKHVHKKRVLAETLRVKMFTSDPDVVIYWIVDKKEGYE